MLNAGRKIEEDHQHELSSVAEGPFKVTKVEDKTVVIERPELSIQRVSRPEKVLEPKKSTVKEVNDILKPLPTTRDYFRYPVGEMEKQPNIVKPSRKGAKTKETDSDSVMPMINNGAQQNEETVVY